MSAMNESIVSIGGKYRTIPILQEDKSYSRNLKDFSYSSFMDEVRKLIVERAKAIGISLKSLSNKLGKNHAYLQQFVKRGVPLDLPERVRHALAALLDVEETALRGTAVKTNIPPSVAPQNARIAGEARIGPRVAVYGHAVGGKDGQFILNGNKVADILAPASLAGVPDAYAVYVVGTSMEPRYFAGEAVFVNPRLPVRKGDFVVAQIAIGDEGEAPYAYVKRFVSMDAKRLRLEQYQPKKALEFPASKVVSVHRIIMGGDG